jgi:small subunit ribosomal protein S16
VAVKIKLKRMGKIRAPFYRVVVADSRTKRDGRAIEEIGKYHPKSDPSFIEIQSERAQYWLSVGAQPTDPVRKLLQITGDWQKFRGEPGAEGTLQMPKPKQSKSDRFAEVVGERKGEGGGETTPKGGGKARKSDDDSGAGSGAKSRRSGGQKRTEAKADAPASDAPAADAPAADAAPADAPAAAAPAEAAAAPAEASAEAEAPAAPAAEAAGSGSEG